MPVHYHVSPARNRASIAAHGLRVWDGPSPYLWLVSDLELAQRMKRRCWAGSRDNDVWQVDTAGIELLVDPHPGGQEGALRGRSYISYVPIAPSRLRRLSAARAAAG